MFYFRCVMYLLTQRTPQFQITEHSVNFKFFIPNCRSEMSTLLLLYMCYLCITVRMYWFYVILPVCYVLRCFFIIFMLFVLFLCFKAQIRLNEMDWKMKSEKWFCLWCKHFSYFKEFEIKMKEKWWLIWFEAVKWWPLFLSNFRSLHSQYIDNLQLLNHKCG